MKVFELGQIFDDFGCLSTDIACGKNMIFRTMQRKAIAYSMVAVKCVQRCSCADKTLSEIDGQCIRSANSTLQVNFSE